MAITPDAVRCIARPSAKVHALGALPNDVPSSCSKPTDVPVARATHIRMLIANPPATPAEKALPASMIAPVAVIGLGPGTVHDMVQTKTAVGTHRARDSCGSWRGV